MAQPGRHRRDPLQRRCIADAGVGVAHVQTQPQPGIVHPGRDLHQRLRRRLHHVLQRHGHILRQLVQQRPPKQHRLLHIPLRVIHVGDEPTVAHHPRHAQLRRLSRRLQKALFRHLPHQRVDGAGRQLGKGRVKPEAIHALHIPAHLPGRLRRIQHGRIAEGGDLIARAPPARQRRRLSVHPGQIQLVFQASRHAVASLRWSTTDYSTLRQK